MAIFATQSPQSGETDLGWSEAQTAATTRSRMAAAIGTSGFLGSNDLLMFRGNYDYAGAEIATSRSDLNITAAQGKGLHITDPAATGTSCYFRFNGDRVKIYNLTITAAGTAGSGFNQSKELIQVEGDDFLMEWCKIDTDLAAVVQLYSSCRRAIIRRNEFTNTSGWASTRNINSFICPVVNLIAPCNDFLYEYNYIHEWRHEHIKTSTGSTTGNYPPVAMPIVRNNFCKNLGRDFIDATGGFSGTGPSNRAIVADNTLISAAMIMDAKFGTAQTKYVSIANNKVYNCTNLIVSTLTNKEQPLSVSPSDDLYWGKAIPFDILLTNNTAQNCTRMGLIKAGLSIVASGTVRRGSTGDVRIFDEAELANSISDDTVTADAIFDYVNDNEDGFYLETGSTFLSTETVPTAPTFSYGPQSGDVEPPGPDPSDDPLFALSGSSFRTNTDLGAMSARTIMAGVENANGADSDIFTVTVS